MTEKDFLKEMGFGELNPFDKALETMFGDAYLDSPDLSQEDIPQGLKEIATNMGREVANISHLIDGAIEKASLWSCEEAQKRMILRLEEYVTREPNPTIGWLDLWAWIKHREHCASHVCAELDFILRMDKYLTPEEMKPDYEESMKKWFPEE